MVKFRMKEEVVVPEDPHNWCLNFNFFNNGNARAQLHPYLDIYDQVKIMK